MINQVTRHFAREKLKDLLLEYPRPYRIIEQKLSIYRKEFTEDHFYNSYRLMIERELREDLIRNTDDNNS